MITTTGYHFEGYRISQYLGIVYGVSVLTPTIAQGFLARLKYIIGGEIGSFTDVSEDGYQDAYRDMIQRAKSKKANAVLNVKFDRAILVPKYSASEVICYGTAVTVEESDDVRKTFARHTVESGDEL